MSKKRQVGQFYTVNSPFNYDVFLAWAGICKLTDKTVLEPFAGAGHLQKHVKQAGLDTEWELYDLFPGNKDVIKRDTLKDFPTGYDVCITNPPWLAKNSAKRLGFSFPDTHYDDLYKYALSLCLENCNYVAAIVPESFIRSGLFTSRLYSFTSIHTDLFQDTMHPSGLALFTTGGEDTQVFSGTDFIGRLSDIKKLRPITGNDIDITFNSPKGNLGLLAVDTTVANSIRFCDIDELKDYQVSQCSRYKTKILLPPELATPSQIKKYNKSIKKLREESGDTLMTCFRGRRKDGKYRRRMDWDLARGVISTNLPKRGTQ